MVDITRAEPVVDHDMAADGGEVGDAFESVVGDAFESGTGVGLGTWVVFQALLPWPHNKRLQFQNRT